MNFKKLLLLIPLLLAITSCEKDSQNLENQKKEEITKTSRASFKNASELEEVYKSYKDSPNKLYNKLKSIGFIKSKKTDFSFSKLATVDPNGNYSIPQDIINEELLIEDPFISEIVNEDLELAVDDVVYKITPYGTLYTPVGNYEEMQDLVEEFNMDKLSLNDAINYELYEHPVANEEGLYEVAPGVMLYDTYEVATTKKELSGRTSGIPQDIVNTVAVAKIQNEEVNAGFYSSLPVIKYGKHTFLGKIWSGIFGGANNEVYTANFSGKRRIKVSLYNRNYVVRKVLGLKVKTQKKNWIGWSGTNADEIRLGWDGISFTMEDKITPANPWDALQKALEPYRPNAYNNSVDWNPNTSSSPIKYEIDLLGHDASLDLSKGFQQGVKLLYDQAKRLNKNVPKNQQSAVSTWLNSQRRQAIVIAGPQELVFNNREEINVGIAHFTDMIVSFNMSGGNVNWQKTAVNSINSTMNASKIVMQYASIYGVARFGNTWKGAYIEKSEN